MVSAVVVQARVVFVAVAAVLIVFVVMAVVAVVVVVATFPSMASTQDQITDECATNVTLTCH